MWYAENYLLEGTVWHVFSNDGVAFYQFQAPKSAVSVNSLKFCGKFELPVFQHCTKKVQKDSYSIDL